MERFFILDKYNTWYDWRLILTAKDVTPPEPKTNYIEIDGASGSLDLSEALTEEITYKNRTVSASFWTDEGTRKDRERRLREIVGALHGRKIKIIEPDDPDHYFYGRVKVKSQSNILPYATFAIEATCEPWRYSLEEITRQYDVNGNAIHIVINNGGAKTLCPTITINGSLTITFGGNETTLTDGVYKISDIKLRRGANVIGLSGNGSIKFEYREADL